MTQPVFLKTDYEAAQHERDKSEISFQKSVNNAITETKNARDFDQSGTVREPLTIADEEIKLAQKAVR